MLNIQCGGSFMEWNKSSQCRSCVCTPAFSKNESQGGGRIGRPFLHTEVKGDGMGMSNQTEEKEDVYKRQLHTSPPSYRLYRLKKRLSHKSISYRKQHPFPDGAFYFYS